MPASNTRLPSRVPRARWSSKIGLRKLRTPFAERANPGNIAYMLAHQIQRNAALELNRDIHGNKLADRDADGYPKPLAVAGVSPLFFDADRMALGVNLDVKFRVECNDSFVRSNNLPRATSDVTLHAQMLPFKRDPKKASDNGEGRTHRSQDFNRKIVLAALLIQNKDDVLDMVQERDRAGRDHWLTKTLPGRTVKWECFSEKQKYTYASFALAFADAYIGFSRPSSRVYYDAFAPIPNTPILVTWLDDLPPRPVQTVSLQLACSGRSRCLLDASGPATAVPVGRAPRHRAGVRDAFLGGHTVTKDEPAFSVKERGRKAIDAVENIRRKYELMRNATIPCKVFAKWCEDNPSLGISNLLPFREAAGEFLRQAKTHSDVECDFTESHSAVRSAAQLVGIIDSLDRNLSRGPRVLSIGKMTLQEPSARLGLAGTTPRTKHNSGVIDFIQAKARKRKLSETYNKLRAKVLRMEPSRQRLVQYMQHEEHATIPDGDEQEVADMVLDFYKTLDCPDVRVEKQLALSILDTMGRSVTAECEGDTVYGSDVGLVVLRNVMSEFLPDAHPDRAKNQASCGGTANSPVRFGIGCGLSSCAEEEYRDNWARLCADEKAAFERQLQREDTERALSRIWDTSRPVTTKLQDTASLCGVVLARRFTSLAKHEQPPHYQPSWASWPEASARVAQQHALWYAKKPRQPKALKKETSRLDQIKQELYPNKAPEQVMDEVEDSDEEGRDGEGTDEE